MVSRIYENFAKVAVFLTIILYVWTYFSSMDDKYESKVLLSAFSVLGEDKESFSLTSTSQMDTDQINNLGKAFFITYMDTFNSGALGKDMRQTDAKSKRAIALAYGETDIRYHLKFIKGAFVPTTLDLSTNALYNVSYIVNTPSKLIHNLKINFHESLHLTSFERITFIVWDVLHAISGIWFASFMIFLGSIIGLLFHPIQSLLNFFPSLWLIITTIWEAISNFKNLG